MGFLKQVANKKKVVAQVKVEYKILLIAPQHLVV